MLIIARRWNDESHLQCLPRSMGPGLRRDDDRGSSLCSTSIVVLAKARTYYPECRLCATLGPQPASPKTTLWLWVPAFAGTTAVSEATAPTPPSRPAASRARRAGAPPS